MEVPCPSLHISGNNQLGTPNPDVKTDDDFLQGYLDDYKKMIDIIQVDPELAEVFVRKDVSKLRAIIAKRCCRLVLRWCPSGLHLDEGQQDKEFANPSNVEALQKFKDVISKKQTSELIRAGLTHRPTIISRMVMPRISVEIWLVRLEAFVDIGARKTVMSKAFAKRCRLMMLLDEGYKNVHGAGQPEILGQIHSVSVKFGDWVYNSCSFLVVDYGDMDFIVFGRDMLSRHKFIIHPEKNVLVVDNKLLVPFLQDEERQEVQRAEVNPRGRRGIQMVEVFQLVVNNSGDLWGEITASGGCRQKLYNRGELNCESIESGQCASLTGPSEYMQADDRFNIVVDLKIKDKDKGIVHEIYGEHYFNPCHRSNKFDQPVNEEFKHSSDDRVEAEPGVGVKLGKVSLSRSIVAVSLGFSLIVHACLKDAVKDYTIVGIAEFLAQLSSKHVRQIRGKYGSILVKVTFSNW